MTKKLYNVFISSYKMITMGRPRQSPIKCDEWSFPTQYAYTGSGLKPRISHNL